MRLHLLGWAAQVEEVTSASGALLLYGIAAPFAALCLVLAFLFRKERDAKATELQKALDRIESMHEEALKREQQLVTGLAPRIYDGALLYREGTRMAEQAAATAPAVAAAEQRLDELAGKLDRLIDGMAEERHRDADRRGLGTGAGE